MKKALLAAAAALLLLAIAVPVVRSLVNPPRVETAAVKRGPAVVTVFATGRVEPRRWRTLRAPRAGVIDSVAVRERQEVRAGETLLVLRDTPRESRRDRIRADLAQAERDLAEGSPFRQAFEARIGEAAAQAGWAERELARRRAVFEAGASTRQELDELESKARAAAESRRTLEEQYRREQEQLASQKRRFAAELATIAAQEEDDRIASPIDGVVMSLDAEPGEYAGVERELVKVGDLRDLLIEADVDEDDIARVRTGQAVLARLAGGVEPAFGTVEEILPDAARDTKTYLVRVRFDAAVFAPDADSPGGLRGRTRVGETQEAFSGMSVELGIVVDRKDDALVIPRGAVTPRGTVFVTDGARLAERAVTTGLANFETCEVLSGVSEGEVVVARDVGELSDGQRVRAGEAAR